MSTGSDPEKIAHHRAMRLVLAALNQDHDMRILILHETDDPDELQAVVNHLTHAAANAWLDVNSGDREIAIANLEGVLMRDLDW